MTETFTDPYTTALALVVEVRRSLHTSPADPQHYAETILQHRQLLQALEDMCEMYRGYRDEQATPIKLVAELHAAIAMASNGHALWTTEVPQGRAPLVRRALNNLLTYYRKANP